jgi:hypothetical protein
LPKPRRKKAILGHDAGKVTDITYPSFEMPTPDPIHAAPVRPSPDAALDARVQAYPTPLEGGQLASTNLAALVGSEPLLLVHILRHLGCIFCKQQVAELRKLRAENPRFPTVIFVHQSTAAVGDAFFAEHFPGAPHIADPKLDLYRIFGILRMDVAQFFNPLMHLKGLSAFFQGQRQTETLGDVNLLSGTFLFRQGRLVWLHRAKHPGEDPSWSRFVG